jgi:hypothetical protein
MSVSARHRPVHIPSINPALSKEWRPLLPFEDMVGAHCLLKRYKRMDESLIMIIHGRCERANGVRVVPVSFRILVLHGSIYL